MLRDQRISRRTTSSAAVREFRSRVFIHESGNELSRETPFTGDRTEAHTAVELKLEVGRAPPAAASFEVIEAIVESPSRCNESRNDPGRRVRFAFQDSVAHAPEFAFVRDEFASESRAGVEERVGVSCCSDVRRGVVRGHAPVPRLVSPFIRHIGDGLIGVKACSAATRQSRPRQRAATGVAQHLLPIPLKVRRGEAESQFGCSFFAWCRADSSVGPTPVTGRA